MPQPRRPRRSDAGALLSPPLVGVEVNPTEQVPPLNDFIKSIGYTPAQPDDTPSQGDCMFISALQSQLHRDRPNCSVEDLKKEALEKMPDLRQRVSQRLRTSLTCQSFLNDKGHFDHTRQGLQNTMCSNVPSSVEEFITMVGKPSTMGELGKHD